MMLHHLTTMIGMLGAFLNNQFTNSLITLLIHDISDVPLIFARMSTDFKKTSK